MNSEEYLIEQYFKETKKIHDTYNRRPNNSKILYHYTNDEAMKKIITTQEFWLTEYRDLKDKSEIKFSIDTISNAVMKFIEMSSDLNLWLMFLCEFPRFQQDQFILTNVQTYVYILSFCENPDNSHLWKAYSNDGEGCCIGFCPSYFEERDNDEDNLCNITINYKQKDFLKLVKKFFRTTDEFYCSAKKIFPKKKLNKLLGGFLTCNLIPLTPGLKKAIFEREKEHRIYEMEMIVNGNSYPARIDTARKFTDGEGKSRLKKSFRKDNISEIWLGKSCRTTEEELNNILQKQGYNTKKIKIKRSKF